MSRIVEIVYRWANGAEEVRYRREADTPGAGKLINEVRGLQRKAVAGGWESPYFWRTAGFDRVDEESK